MIWKRLVVLVAVCLGALALSPIGPATATTTLRWDLAHDMSQNQSGNPIADSYGNPGVWSFERVPASGETSQGTLLTAYGTNDTCHVAYHGDAANGFPYVGYHDSFRAEPCGTATFPAYSAYIHPSYNGDNGAIRWTSPVTGTVQVAATIDDADPNGGDGVTYQLSDDNGSYLAGGVIDNGGSSGPVSFSTNVTAGQSLYLLVGPRGGYDYDNTAVSLVITAADQRAPVSLSTSVSAPKAPRHGMQKTTLKVTLRGAKGGPTPTSTNTVTADGFLCSSKGAPSSPKGPSKVVCVGSFAPGPHTTEVRFAGDNFYAPATTTVTFTVPSQS